MEIAVNLVAQTQDVKFTLSARRDAVIHAYKEMLKVLRKFIPAKN